MQNLGSIAAQALHSSGSQRASTLLSSWTKSWPSSKVIQQLAVFICPRHLTSVSTRGPSFFHPHTPLLRQTNIVPSRIPLPFSNFIHVQTVSSKQSANISSASNAKMGSVLNVSDAPTVRVFIAGGSYAGLSVAANLLDLGQGLSPRMFQQPYEHHPNLPRVNWDITIADERDGFCK